MYSDRHHFILRWDVFLSVIYLCHYTCIYCVYFSDLVLDYRCHVNMNKSTNIYQRNPFHDQSSLCVCWTSAMYIYDLWHVRLTSFYSLHIYNLILCCQGYLHSWPHPTTCCQGYLIIYDHIQQPVAKVTYINDLILQSFVEMSFCVLYLLTEHISLI